MSQALNGNQGPGQSWKYDAVGSGWINHMPKVIASATGRQSTAIWKSEFHEPLGLSKSFSWGNANTMWAAGSQGTCRDYARIGQLLLNKGKWAGVAKNIIPAEYVHQMSIPQTRYAPYNYYSNTCYGLLTWINENQNKVQYPPKAGTGVCGLIGGPIPKQDEMPASSPSNIFFLDGANGQIVTIFPSLNTVAVTMGNTLDAAKPSGVLTEAIWCTAFGNKC